MEGIKIKACYVGLFRIKGKGVFICVHKQKGLQTFRFATL